MDYIIDSGTTTATTGGRGVFSWLYRIWNSGRKECEGFYTTTVDINSAWGSWYESPALPNVLYPFTFSQKPAQQISVTGPSGTVVSTQASHDAANGGTQYKTQTCGVVCLRPTQATNVEVTIHYRAYGV